jgi:hypothetical protein
MTMQDPPPGLPAALAQRQLDAYNAHDLDAFAACFSPDVEAWLLPEMTLYFQGRDMVRERYGIYFEARRPAARLVGRLTMGGFALDQEEVVMADGARMEAVAIYQVEGALIRRIWFIKG